MKLKNKSMLTALSALLVSSSAMAQSVDLTMKWKAGRQYDIKQSIKMDTKMPNPQGGADINQKMNIGMGMGGASSVDEKGIVVDMKITTLSMNVSMSGAVLMSYDSTKPDQDNPMDSVMAPLLELKFKSLYGKDGKFIELKNFDEEMLTPDMGLTRESLESVMKQQAEMIPNREVKVGETWNSTLITPMQGFEGVFSCNYDFKLVSVKKVNGRQIAKIQYTADMKNVKVKQKGMDMMLSAKNIDGYYLFDVKDGQFTESKSFFDMVADVQGTKMMLKMNMKINFRNSPLKK